MMMLTTKGRKRKEAPAPIGQEAQPAADHRSRKEAKAMTTTASSLPQLLAVDI
jgi:hypothetical protein